MNDFEVLQMIGVLYFVFAVRMKIWQTSINTFIVFCTAFVVAISYQVEELKFVFENRVWLFNATLTFLFARVAYQQIYNKYYDRYGVKLGRATDRLDAIEKYCHETGCPMLHKKIEEKKDVQHEQ